MMFQPHIIFIVSFLLPSFSLLAQVRTFETSPDSIHTYLVEGKLEEGDIKYKGVFSDTYKLTVRPGDRIYFQLVTSDFCSALTLTTDNGDIIESYIDNSDCMIGSYYTSRINEVLENSTYYSIKLHLFGSGPAQTGRYKLKIVVLPKAAIYFYSRMSSCEKLDYLDVHRTAGFDFIKGKSLGQGKYECQVQWMADMKAYLTDENGWHYIAVLAEGSDEKALQATYNEWRQDLQKCSTEDIVFNGNEFSVLYSSIHKVKQKVQLILKNNGSNYSLELHY